MYEKLTKIRFYEKRYNFENKQNSGLKIFYDNLITGNQSVSNLQARTSWTD